MKRTWDGRPAGSRFVRAGRLTPGPGLDDGRLGRRTALAAVVLLATGAAVAGLTAALPDGEPTEVGQVRLTGPRSPGCLRLLVLPDQSGSMADYATAREAALAQVLAWAPRNLDARDELAVVNWAGSADLTLPPTPVEDVGTSVPARQLAVPDGTVLDGVLDVLASLPATTCRTTLVFLSDGVLTQKPVQDTDAVLAAAGVAQVTTVLPTGDSVPDEWEQLFPYGSVATAEATDPGANALAIAEVLAAATGQEVEEVD
jgi:hypothetical protein